MAKKEKTSQSESESKDSEKNVEEKPEIYEELGKEELINRLNTLKKTIKKNEQVIRVLEEENEVLKRDIKDKEYTISDLKESVLNLELMLNKAQKGQKAKAEKKKEDKTLDYFMP